MIYMEVEETPPELVESVEQQFQTTSSPEMEKPKRKSLTDKLADFAVNNKKEMWFMNWNLSLFMWEMMRDASHYTAESGAYGGIGRGIPIATEGIGGFIDQHIGNTVETLELFYLSRIPVSLVARAVEMATDKKVDPRVKLGASLLLSTTIVSGLELSGAAGGVPDPLDLVGVGAAAIWASVGYEVIDYLFKPRETPLLEQWFNKISQVAKSMEGIDKKVLAKLDTWISMAPPPSVEDIAIAQAQSFPQVLNANVPRKGLEPPRP